MKANRNKIFRWRGPLATPTFKKNAGGGREGNSNGLRMMIGGNVTIQFIRSLYPDVSYTERKDVAYLYRFLAPVHFFSHIPRSPSFHAIDPLDSEVRTGLIMRNLSSQSRCEPRCATISSTAAASSSSSFCLSFSFSLPAELPVLGLGRPARLFCRA